MRRAILFDFNGVIIDDEAQHCEALTAVLAEYEIPLDRDTYYRDYLGFDDRECFRFTFAQHGRPTDGPALADGEPAGGADTTSSSPATRRTRCTKRRHGRSSE